MTMNHALVAESVGETELEQLSSFAASLPQGSPVAVLVHSVVSAVMRGSDVAVFEADSEVTPNEAADLLHMSRPHLLKFLDRGDLAFHRVGSHRRIRMSDLLDFIDRRERAKAEVAHALGNGAAIAQRVRDGAAELAPEVVAELNAL